MFYAALRGVASRRLLRFNDMLTFTASLHGGEVGADAHLVRAIVADDDDQALTSSVCYQVGDPNATTGILRRRHGIVSLFRYQ